MYDRYTNLHLTDDERQILFNRLTSAVLHRATTMRDTFSEHLRAYMSERAEIVETGCMMVLIGLLTIRGADPQAIARHATAGDEELPFRGCERSLLDTILAAIPDDVDVTRLVVELATWFDEWLGQIAQDIHTTRPQLCQLLLDGRRPQSRDANR